MDKGWRGEVLIVASAVLFAGSSAFMKLAVREWPALQVAWVRFAVPAVLLWAAGHGGWLTLRPRRPGLLWLRALLMGVGVSCAFAAVGLTTFSNFMVLVSTNTIFGTLISSWYFGEAFRARHGVVLGLAFLGVVLVVRPEAGWTFQAIRTGDFLALAAGLVFGLSLAVVKEAVKTETVWMITLAAYLGGVGVAAPFSLVGFAPFTWKAVGLLAGVMALGTAAQLLETRGYREVSVAVGGSLSYIAVVLGILIGAWGFGEPVGPGFLLGATLIVGCGAYLLWRVSDGAVKLRPP